jgi:5-methyltetrahydrofolate--homocysteine methyltransferase
MSDFLERLKTEVLLGVGSYATSLVDKGYNMAESYHWWIFNHPDIFQDLVKAFAKAGCDILDGVVVNKLRLKPFGLEDKASEINYKLMKISRAVTPSDRYFACGFSTGEYLPPISDATVDELYGIYQEMVAIGLDAEVDLFTCVIQGIQEGELAIKAIRDKCQLPILATLGFYPTSKGFRTMEGIEPAEGAKKFEEIGVDVIGTQCGGTSLEEATTVLKQMSTACSSYLMVRPNAGKPQLVNGTTVWPATPEEMAREAPNWVSAGARFIAGCCGVTPEHIAKVAVAVK